MKLDNRLKCIISHPYFPILALIIANLVVGLFIVQDFGESWDEAPRYAYAYQSLYAYIGKSSAGVDEKGPFYVMVSALVSDAIHKIQPDWLIQDIRHFMHFLVFLMGLFFLYRLSCRFTNKWAAFGGVLLFNTQPLLWGHAFINPKDIPFMSFFVLSIDSGFAMASSLYKAKKQEGIIETENEAKKTPINNFTQGWKRTSQTQRRTILILSLTALFLIVGLYASQRLVQDSIQNLILDAYSNNSNATLETLFNELAQKRDEIPAESYIQKAWILYGRLINYGALLIFFIWGLSIFRIFSKTNPDFRLTKVASMIKPIWMYLRDSRVILAGIALGLTSSIRTLGPAAGILVGLYLLLLWGRRQSLQVLAAYFLIGAATTYLTWPSLWQTPIKNFLASTLEASNFLWEGKVLFNGISYPIGTTPKTYLPVLLSLQLTLSALITSVTGFGYAIFEIARKNVDWRKFAVIALWFLAPVSYVILFQPKIYDNFRHFLFIVPPLFILSAIGFQWIFTFFKAGYAKLIILLVFILPNIFSLIQLHPYPYVYYNAFTDGIHGAFRKYEMDYWATSYREATNYLNRNAPSNSRVIVYGANHIVETYAREDLVIEKYQNDLELDCSSPTYAVLLSRGDKDIYLFPDSEVVFTIGKDDSVFTVIKYLNNPPVCDP